jgi:hypothetical protein
VVLDGPPRFGEGRLPGPPPLIVFGLVDTAALPPGWFDPEEHTE